MPVYLTSESVERSPLLNTVESQINNVIHFDEIELFSPKLLSIIPESQQKRNKNKNSPIQEMLMSPTFFSFHEEGNYSIQYLLNVSISSTCFYLFLACFYK